MPVRSTTLERSKDRTEDRVISGIAAKVRARRKHGVEPHDDFGFFGPDSVAWRVWGYPTSLTVGFQRAVVVEELDPFLLASVQATNKVRTQARIRYDRTIRYFATVAF